VRIALVSDIHGNLPALRAVAADIAAARVDAVLNLGDIASGPLWPRETVQWLAEQGWPTIAGNHERQALAAAPGQDDDDAFAAAELGAAERTWLQALPATLVAADGDIQAFHGIPGNDLHGLLETVTADFMPGIDPGVHEANEAEVARRLNGLRAAVLVCGHTHTPRVRRLGDGTLLVNPGSVGRPAYAHDRPYRHVVETGSPAARWALLTLDQDHWHAELRATAYDHAAAVARALASGVQGARDWAHELARGRTRPQAFS
jgi:predicted phosphodiesterase